MSSVRWPAPSTSTVSELRLPRSGQSPAGCAVMPSFSHRCLAWRARRRATRVWVVKMSTTTSARPIAQAEQAAIRDASRIVRSSNWRSRCSRCWPTPLGYGSSSRFAITSSANHLPTSWTRAPAAVSQHLAKQRLPRTVSSRPDAHRVFYRLENEHATGSCPTPSSTPSTASAPCSRHHHAGTEASQ